MLPILIPTGQRFLNIGERISCGHILDDQMRVVEGNGLFYTDGEYLWRNKRSELFLHPHYDREWMSQEQNPYDDYVVIPLTDVSQILATQRPAKWLR